MKSNPELDEELIQLAEKVKEKLAEARTCMEKEDDPAGCIHALQEAHELTFEMFETEYGSLTEATLDKHIFNLNMYLEHWAEYDGIGFDKSLDLGYLNSYFGDWYISHVMFSSPASTKASLTALKKYAAMLEKYQLLPQGSTASLKADIKEEIGEWIERMRMYADSSIPYEDYFERVHGFRPNFY